jgi:hypothetical protein
LGQKLSFTFDFHNVDNKKDLEEVDIINGIDCMLNLLGANRFEDDSIKTAKELFRLNNSEKELKISRGWW